MRKSTTSISTSLVFRRICVQEISGDGLLNHFLNWPMAYTACTSPPTLGGSSACKLRKTGNLTTGSPSWVSVLSYLTHKAIYGDFFKKIKNLINHTNVCPYLCLVFSFESLWSFRSFGAILSHREPNLDKSRNCHYLCLKFKKLNKILFTIFIFNFYFYLNWAPCDLTCFKQLPSSSFHFFIFFLSFTFFLSFFLSFLTCF